jgi:hypothetical protein
MRVGRETFLDVLFLEVDLFALLCLDYVTTSPPPPPGPGSRGSTCQ